MDKPSLLTPHGEGLGLCFWYAKVVDKVLSKTGKDQAEGIESFVVKNAGEAGQVNMNANNAARGFRVTRGGFAQRIAEKGTGGNFRRWRRFASIAGVSSKGGTKE